MDKLTAGIAQVLLYIQREPAQRLSCEPTRYSSISGCLQDQVLAYAKPLTRRVDLGELSVDLPPMSY